MREQYLPTVCPDCRHKLVEVKDRVECHNPDRKVIRVDGNGRVVRAYALSKTAHLL